MSKSVFEGRSETINYDAISGLTYLGNYTRRLPVNITRMMENAFDWEHLPYIHRSSFAAIEGVDEGHWGWRAKGYLSFGDVSRQPNDLSRVDEDCAQYIELLVDDHKHYWATTVVSGIGAGTQIHTQATPVSDQEIDIDVRFYVDGVSLNDTDKQAILGVLKDQYAQLYDEDIGLMQGRQTALNSRKGARSEDELAPMFVGLLTELREQLPRVVQYRGRRFCVNYWRQKWIVYSADCPHMMGPLEGETIAEDGSVTCPWHGYRFNVETGELCEGRSGKLAVAPAIMIQQDKLFLVDHAATE